MTSSEAWRDWLLGSLSDHIAKLSSVPPRKIPALEAFQSPGSFSDKYSCQAGPGPRFPPRPALPCLSVSSVLCFSHKSQRGKAFIVLKATILPKLKLQTANRDRGGREGIRGRNKNEKQ